MIERRSPGLSISARINLAFAAFAGLLILLVVCASIGLLAGNNRFSKFSGIAGVAEQLTMVSRDVVSMDRRAGRYAYGGDGEDLQVAQKRSEHIGAALAALIADENATEVRDGLRRMEELLAAYSSSMLKMAEVRAQRENLVNWKLNGIGIKARSLLMQIAREAAAAGDTAGAASAGIANDHLQGGRLNVYKFLALPGAQLSGAVGSQMDAFIKSCETLAGTVQAPAHRALAVEAGELGREYQAVFAQLAVAANTVASLVNGTLAQYGAEMRDIARKVSASRRQKMDDVRQASYEDTAWTMGLFVAAALLAIAAGGFIALWTARAVVLPLRGLSETIVRLSSGETAITVEGTRRQDEIGVLARALEHFRLSIMSEIEAQRTLQTESEARCARCKSGQTAQAGAVDTVEGADTKPGYHRPS